MLSNVARNSMKPLNLYELMAKVEVGEKYSSIVSPTAFI
jgi:hypothetical protein